MIENMKKYMIEFVEKSHPAFNGLPPCPFVKRARVKDLIQFEVLDFNCLEDMTGMIGKFRADKEVMIVMHPGEISLENINALLEELNVVLRQQGLWSFAGHPEDVFEIAGLRTHRDPYPNIQIIKQQTLDKARGMLPERYYAKWTQEQISQLGIKK